MYKKKCDSVKTKKSESLMVVWLTGECRSSGGEDEDHSEERTDSEVVENQFLISCRDFHPTLTSFLQLQLMLQK